MFEDRPFQDRLLLICFLLSGATGLAYEVTATRLLARTFGSANPAIATILATFMGGLALGSYLFGRIAERTERPAFLYGLFEIGVGIYALFLVPILLSVEKIYLLLYPVFGDNALGNFSIRFLLTGLVLGFPTILMGGTFPILCRRFGAGEKRRGERISVLYGLNIVGAVAGAFFTGVFLMGTIGISMTIRSAAILNILIGCLIVVISRRWEKPPEAAPSEAAIAEAPPAEEPERQSFLIPTGVIVLIAGLSGFLSLGLEVAFARLLSLVLGSSVYAFSIILAVFLVGFGFGSIVIARIIDRWDKTVILALVNLFTGIFLAVSLSWMGNLPFLYLFLFQRIRSDFPGLLALSVAIAGITILLPALAMGTIFPSALAAYVERTKHVGRKTGSLYAVNTLGSVAGSALSGFVFLPLIGAYATSRYIALAYCLAAIPFGFFVIVQLKWTKRIIRISVLLVLIAAVAQIAVPKWDPAIMTSGVYVYANRMQGISRNVNFLFYEEGLHSIVTVVKGRTQTQPVVRSLVINGKADGSDGADMISQVLVAQLPLLLHPSPKDVLVIGHGTGVSCGTALQHQIDNIVVMEIDASVLRASTLFGHVNHVPMTDARCRVVVQDARGAMVLDNTKYDVIVAEPSNPWISGVSNLFTQDCFLQYKDCLKPDGIVCQWVHTYRMDIEVLRSIIMTFRSVFPELNIFSGAYGDLLIVAGEIEWDGDRIGRRMLEERVAHDLKRVGINSVDELHERWLLRPDDILPFCGDARINTDDNPWVEFNAPKSLYRQTVYENMDAINNAGRARPAEREDM